MEVRNEFIRPALGAAAPAQPRNVLSGSLSLAFALGLLLVSGRPSAGEARPGQFGTRSLGNTETNIPTQFSEGTRVLQTNVTFDDVQFPQSTFALVPVLFKLSVRFKDGVLALLPPSNTVSDMFQGRPAKSVIWEGPIDKAQFVLQTLAGTNTISDADGKVIWSDAEETSKFDLRLNRDPTGKAELIDRQGATLWSGNLKLPEARETSYCVSRDHYTIEAGGLTIEGDKQSAEITENRGARIWSGALPFRPIVAINDTRGYLHYGPHGFEGGSDRKVRLQFASESGAVTVDDEEHAPLGTRPVPILRLDTTSLSMHQTTVAENSKSVDLPSDYFIPRAELSIDGTVYVTYRDTAGKILRRCRAYKDRNATGYTSEH